MKKEKRKITDENLSAIFAQAKGMHARLAYQARELVLSLSDEGVFDIDTACSTLIEAYEVTKELDRSTAFNYLRALAEVMYDTIGADAMHRHIRALFSYSDELDPRALGKVCYLRNKFTDKAFDKFAKHIDDAKILHAGSFEDSCEDVYNGVCQYCILPTENSVDGRLGAFHKLIKKYDLHMMASTSVQIDETVTTLSLLARDADFLALGDSTKGRMFKFGVTCKNTSDISGIIEFASAYGMKLSRIHSIKGEDGVLFTLMLSTDGVQIKMVELFTFCFSAIYPAFTVTGFYRHIN